ncbi:Cu/Ag efflux protein CusF [Paucibacter oligotrophus]|uniref:Cu/Ag efflux protein CusF n=1 Tax=Roseateles oligotrophus TaxID=1769250 RepID=A0A840LE42_9BURK|nr:copper-binding protein [Roseateles oligotrophus]MBB4844468.1 Cu/Ag efflux protein CusF [Roseateles oligotrophus]
MNKHALALSLLLSLVGAAHATMPTPQPAAAAAASEAQAQAPELAEGEIRRIDVENKKITIKHGPIKSLAMPGMTMVFVLKDEAQLNALKVGDKIRFDAARIEGVFVVTRLQRP